MPRGFPNKKPENNSEIKLDLISEPENVEAALFDAPQSDTEKQNKSADVPKKLPEVINTDEYTIDPHTGQKYLKPKGDAPMTYQTRGRIPQINIPGFRVIWPINTTDSTFYDLVQQGYEFVDPKSPGCSEAIPVPAGSRRPDGVAIVHKAMMISEAKFLDLEARKELARQQKESDTIFNPGATIQGDAHTKGYTGKEHRAPRISNRDMDMSMSQKFQNAMR